MTRVSMFSNPLMLGFDQLERLSKQLTESGKGSYPPFNIERFEAHNGDIGLRIVLAVAGFGEEMLDIEVENNELTISGYPEDQEQRQFMYRGIAARRFKRTFLLADGLNVTGAKLDRGLLTVNLTQPIADKAAKKIKISKAD